MPGNISSIKPGNTYKGYDLIYNLSRVPGLSGSPLFNEQGKVIGIYGLEDDKATLTLGISIDTYKRFATLASPSIAMARSDSPDSASSQFYFTLDKISFLDGNYAVFGQITQGLEVMDVIQQGDKIISARVTQGLGSLQLP